jgi:hypothetical protein
MTSKVSAHLTNLLRGACFLVFLIAHAGAGMPQNPASSLPHVDPKAQQLLDQVIQALGGPAFLHFKTLTTKGRIFAISEGATSGLAPYESSVEYPDKRRFSYGKNPPVILINNGDNAWELDRYGLTSQLPEQVERWKVSNRYSLENLLRLRIHDPGLLIQESGVDFVDNVPTHVLDIIEPQGITVKLDLSRQSLLPTRIRYRALDSKTHDWDDYTDVYGDYRLIQGIQTPMHITRYANDERVSEIYRNFAKYDQTYPADYFRPDR